jgi:hypothetical protein
MGTKMIFYMQRCETSAALCGHVLFAVKLLNRQYHCNFMMFFGMMFGQGQNNSNIFNVIFATG